MKLCGEKKWNIFSGTYSENLADRQPFRGRRCRMFRAKTLFLLVDVAISRILKQHLLFVLSMSNKTMVQ
jgi:hypothetical protein